MENEDAWLPHTIVFPLESGSEIRIHVRRNPTSLEIDGTVDIEMEDVIRRAIVAEVIRRKQ